MNKAEEKTNKNIIEYLKENKILYDIDEKNDKVIANYEGYDISISKETNEIQNIENRNGYAIQYNDNNDKKFDSNDNLYVIKNTDKSWEYCVGTRAKDNFSASLYDISQEGSIQVNACWKDTAAIRLVVCLKSNVMTKKYSGTWVIS